jgi:hypothetical protein
MYLQKVISRKIFSFLVFCWRLEDQRRKKQDLDPPTSQRHGSADPYPDPYQNVMDPQHEHIKKNYYREYSKTRARSLTFCQKSTASTETIETKDEPYIFYEKK